MSRIVTITIAIEVPEDFDTDTWSMDPFVIFSDASETGIAVDHDSVIHSTCEPGIPGSMTSNELADTAQGWADAAGNAW